MSLEIILIGAGMLALAVGGVGYMLRATARRARRDAAHFASLKSQGLHLPASLHPVIDPDICMGSLACVRACPEGDILGIVDGAARLIEGSRCIGHGRCAASCPVDAIRLVFGTSERGVDLPEVSSVFETSRPGLHIVGELGGMGLIRNAMTQGVQVVEHLKATLGTSGAGNGPDATVADVVIVGSGPAGLATAAACRVAGLTCRLLEQDTFGGTVAHYPRQKLVMSEPVELPGYGRFGKPAMRKEELLAAFDDVRKRLGVTVEEGVRVEAVEGEKDRFVVRTGRGPVPGRRVVLAIGRRGTPRRLGVPGEEGGQVTYRLVEPEQYRGKRILVVGGGDSALEAALMLADEPGTEVTVSYRSPAFGRCRPQNREAVESRIAAGRIRALMSSQVRAVEPGAVRLDTPDGALRLDNDYVIVNIGGELPTTFLEKAGVSVRRHQGDEAPIARRPEKALADRASRRLALSFVGAGAVIVTLLAGVGWDYYTLPLAVRRDSALHPVFGPAGWWGHGVGIAATLFMMLNFVYAARKRLGWLGRTGSTRNWLTFHMFVGFMSPAVIAFHAAFQTNNLLATVTAVALAIVVLTGVVGRFIWGLVPSSHGRAVELATLRSRFERLSTRVKNLRALAREPALLRELIRAATADPEDGGFLPIRLVRVPVERLRVRRLLRRARGLFDDEEVYREVREAVRDLLRLRLQVGFYRGLRRLLSGWRAFHVTLAVLMVLVIAAHIAVSLLIGYRWIFS